MEKIKTYASFNDQKPEINKLNQASQVHENEVKDDEETEKEESPEEFLQKVEDDSSATEIQMDERLKANANSQHAYLENNRGAILKYPDFSN